MNRLFYISPLILQTAIWPATRVILRFFVHLKIFGIENIQQISGNVHGVIFAVNHSSELDPILVPASLPFLSPLAPMFYTSRDQSFYKRSGWRRFLYGGFLFKLWGAHRLHSGLQNYEQSLETHIGLLQDGKSLCIFPDGKRLPESDIGTVAHGGVAYLLWRTGATVVPVRIKNAHIIRPVDLLLRRRHVSVIFGKPLSATEVLLGNGAPSIEDFKVISFRIMRSVKELATPCG